ncbi:MAG: protein-export chaperone SecB [Burkholderiales bacterium]
MAEEKQPLFSIEKLYTKDASLEIPHAPQIFLERDPPQIDVQLHNSSSPINEGYYEAVLTVTVTAKIGDKTLFLTEVSQAGIFQIRNVPESDLPAILNIACPNIIFPYARETISDLVTRAGFPPVLLNPVNFEALYQAQAQQSQADHAAKH